SLRSVGWPEGHGLRDHQLAGLGHALSAIHSANFSVPGAGKTATALAVAATHLLNDTIDVVIVVGPLSAFDPWEREAALTLPDLLQVRRIRGSATERSRAYAGAHKGSLLICSYATAAADRMALSELCDQFRVMLIVDESHRIKRL